MSVRYGSPAYVRIRQAGEIAHNTTIGCRRCSDLLRGRPRVTQLRRDGLGLPGCAYEYSAGDVASRRRDKRTGRSHWIRKAGMGELQSGSLLCVAGHADKATAPMMPVSRPWTRTGNKDLSLSRWCAKRLRNIRSATLKAAKRNSKGHRHDKRSHELPQQTPVHVEPLPAAK